jgi:peptide deformylase
VCVSSLMSTLSGSDDLRYHKDMAATQQTDRERAEAGRREREARREIRVIGDPVLREHALEVTTFDRSLRKLAKRMIRIMHDAPGVGLAAPQIGVLQRLLVYDVDDDPQALVNPVLDEFSEETEEADEGCLSVPGVTMPVERPVSLRVRGFDASGEPVDYRADGLQARVIQHEYDHLEGVLIVDRTTRSARAAALRELRDREDAGYRGAVGGGL